MVQNSKNTYKKFFLENDLVLSSYFSFAWTTKGIGDFSKLINIRQKLDKKLFLGIKKIKTNKIILNKAFVYDSKNKDFEEIFVTDILKKEEKIKNFLSVFIKNKDFGFEINLLSEIPRGYTLGFSGTFASLVVSSIELFLGNINKEIFESDILENKNDFKDLRKKAFLLESEIKNNNTAGEASFMAFVNSKNPILYNISEDKKEYLALDLLKNNSFPLGYFVIFSGLKVDSDRIEKQIKNNLEKFKSIEKELLEKYSFPENSFTKNILQTSKTYESLNNVFVSLNSFSLYYINKIIESENKEDIKKFLDNINKIRYALRIFEEQIDFAEKFYSFFLNLRKYFESNIGITSGTSAVNGGTFIVFYEEKEADTIKNIILKMKKNYPDLQIIFDSKKKINSNNFGINIEQFISQKILGNYSNKKGVLLKDNKKTQIIEYKDLQNLDYDILIDIIKNKIYIGGKKLTSKEIHSQSAAVEILTKLLESSTKKLKNTDLSFGSYRENKIELNGKVVLPFKKLIEERLNYEFPLQIKGKIGDYEIKLEKHNLKIGIIERI